MMQTYTVRILIRLLLLCITSIAAEKVPFDLFTGHGTDARFNENAYLGLIFNGSRPVNYTIEGKFSWDYPKAGGFTPEFGLCPEFYIPKNGFCWIKEASYYLEIRNKFIENYDAQEKMADIDAHYNMIIAWTGENSLLGNVPIPDIPIYLSHTKNKSATILLADGQKVALRGNETLALRTNKMGRLIFSVMEDGTLDLPILKAHAPFMDTAIAESFAVNTHALHELMKIDGQMLKEKGIVGSKVSFDSANATAQALQTVLRPLYTAGIQGTNKPLYKRFFGKQKDKRPVYHIRNNKVRTYQVARDEDLELELNWGTDQKHFELVLSGEHEVELIEHSPESISLLKRSLETQHVGLMRRSYFADLGRKIKNATMSFKNFTKNIFVDIPRSVFNKTAIKEGKQSYVNNVQKSVSDATKNGVTLTRDLIAIAPLGDIINENMGINELVKNITSSDRIIITPLTYGLELVLLGPGTANKHLVQSVKGIWAVVTGLLKRIGVTIKAMFAFIKSLFQWDDIILNHHVLSAHYRKMIPFMKANIASRHGNFSSSLMDTVNRFDNFTEQASNFVTAGNFNSLADLIAKANREIYMNATQNAAKKDPNDFDDIQSSFIADHIASTPVVVNIARQDQANILVLMKDVFKEIASIGSESWKELQVQWKSMADELQASNWSLTVLFSVIWRMFRFLMKFLVQKVLQLILLVFDMLITFMDKILRGRPHIPFISPLYEKITGSRLSLYGLFALGASLPVTVAFKAFNKGVNMFTKQEAAVLIATAVPEYYIENLVAFGMQIPGKNPLKLRNMYRRTVSYIIGAGYAGGQLFSTLVGAVVNNGYMIYALRAPLELMSIMCNYPWSWYTESETKLGLNVRFMSWVLQFVPFFTSWPTEVTVSNRIPWLTMLIALVCVIPNVVMVIRVWVEDIRLIRSQNGKADGSTTFDVTMKGIARLTAWIPRLLLAIHEQPDKFFATLRLLLLAAAVMHNVRLYADIPSNAIYSV